MSARWSKKSRPPSVEEFTRRFPDDHTCAAALAEHRWPDGFVCPHCRNGGWRLETKVWTWQCRSCGRQTSVTAGTVMHRSKVPLRKWFLAAHLVVTHSNGISALQLQPAVGVGSYKTAWLMLHKLRRAMVHPHREPLAGLVEVDETTLPYRTAQEPVAGGRGRSHVGKMPVICAVEVLEVERRGRPTTMPGRVRLEPISRYSRPQLHRFINANVDAGATVRTDALRSYRGLQNHEHEQVVVEGMPAHIAMPWVHRVFSQLKRWAFGVYHGLRPHHLQAYLNEFTFRWNRRWSRRSSLNSLLDIVAVSSPQTYEDVIGRPPRRKQLHGHIGGPKAYAPREVRRQSERRTPFSSKQFRTMKYAA